MKNVIPLLIGCSLLNAGPLFAVGGILYQEPLGAPSSLSGSIHTNQYLGVRFEADQPWHITSIQTEVIASSFLIPSESSYFAALVQLPSVTSVPQGNPFTDNEVALSTVFSVLPHHEWWLPIDIPFEVTLEPGAYAVVIGSGAFGSSGPFETGLLGYERLPESNGFGWTEANAWDSIWPFTWDIAIVGEVVPEPSGGTMTALGLFVLTLLRRTICQARER